MIRANVLNSPIFQKYTILFSKGKNTKFDVTEYQHLVKKLIYLSQIIQLDLAFVINSLRQYMEDLYLGH